MEREKNHDITPGTKEFVKKNWPYALVIGGTLAGAAVWITARYLKQRKSRESEAYINLDQIEQEVQSSTDKAAVILETGSQLEKVAGNELEIAVRELKEHIHDMDAQEIFEVLSNLARIEGNRRKLEEKNKKFPNR